MYVIVGTNSYVSLNSLLDYEMDLGTLLGTSRSISKEEERGECSITSNGGCSSLP